MSTPQDPTASADAESVRVDAPTAPVTSGPGPAAPPRKTRRGSAAMVSATVAPDVTEPAPAPAPAEPIDAAELTELDDFEDTPTRRSRRKEKPAPAPRPMMAPRSERLFRQTVVKVDLWSVTKLSLCFYLSAMFVTLVALIALWVIADAAGVIGSIEKFLGELLSAEKGTFQFLSGEVLRGTILIGLVVVALQVVITVVAASFYNIFAELFGGIEMTIKEEQAPPRQ